MAARLCNQNFLNDLALMIDKLHEMSLLSTALQARSLSMPSAENQIKRSIKEFEILKASKGTFKKKLKKPLLLIPSKMLILMKTTDFSAFLVKRCLR